jgi:hypothetical protein
MRFRTIKHDVVMFSMYSHFHGQFGEECHLKSRELWDVKKERRSHKFSIPVFLNGRVPIIPDPLIGTNNLPDRGHTKVENHCSMRRNFKFKS